MIQFRQNRTPIEELQIKCNAYNAGKYGASGRPRTDEHFDYKSNALPTELQRQTAEEVGFKPTEPLQVRHISSMVQ